MKKVSNKPTSNKVADFKLDKTVIDDPQSKEVFQDLEKIDLGGDQNPPIIVDMKKRDFIKKVMLGDLSSKKDYNISDLKEYVWEYVLVFENPDYSTDENEAIDRELAEKVYRKCFRPKKTDNVFRDRITFLNEKMAFLDVFDSLNPFETGKALKKGGRMSVTDGNVIDTGSRTKDFMTLIRNAVLFKLVYNLSLKVKQLVSTTGEYIYFIITADEEDLEIEAEKSSFSKQLEIALVDIQSLLPCDITFRPLNLLRFNDDEIISLGKAMKHFTDKALKIEKSTEKVDYKYDPEGVTPAMLQAYKIYLSLLKEGIEKIQANVHKENHQMFLFQKLIKDSIQKANLGLKEQDKLKNLWDRLGIQKAIAPYADYRRSNAEDELHNLWRHHKIDKSGKRSLFRGMERIRLLVSLIEREVILNSLEDKGYIAAHYPLHNNWQLKGRDNQVAKHVTVEDMVLSNVLIDFKPIDKDLPLIDSWNTALFNQKVPLNKIKNYFGEKIALYFEFIRYYQVALLMPAIIGLVVFILQQLYATDNPIVLSLNAIYSIFMTVWATVMLEGWMRREASLAIVWGQTKFEKTEVPRPQYKGELRRSPITDDMEEVHFEDSKRTKYFILAFSVSLFIISLVLGIVAGLVILKWTLAEKLTGTSANLAGPVCSAINAVQILVFNYIYTNMARYLTDLENHKTVDSYQDSLILKIFAFQFVNSFNSICYIAFAKTYIEGCIVSDSNGNQVKTIGASCMNELSTQLIIIFIVSYIKNLIELAVPLVKFWINRRRKTRKIKNPDTQPKDIREKIEKQLYFDYYLNSDQDGTIDDYMEVAIQFGYLTLFALAFPLSTTLTFVGLWFEMITDKIKVTRLVRRPLPLSTKDIGSWWGIFSSICVFAIFSNTALFCFTAPTFDNWPAAKNYSYIIFAVIVIILLIFRSQLQSWIPDVPQRFDIVSSRHDFIVERVLRGSDGKNYVQDEEDFDNTMYFAKAKALETENI